MATTKTHQIVELQLQQFLTFCRMYPDAPKAITFRMAFGEPVLTSLQAAVERMEYNPNYLRSNGIT